MKLYSILATCLTLGACAGAPAGHAHHHPAAPDAAATPAPTVGIIVAAPDRGFLGNEEIRDAVESLGDGNAALIFVTDARTRDDLAAAVEATRARGAARAVVLPLFV